MMNWLAQVWERIVESLGWLSVQVTAGWGVVWVIYSQLPPDVMTQIAETKIWLLNIPGWMGIAQTVMTYLARLHKPKASN